MGFSPSTPVTGATVTGSLTSPTYTIALDVAPTQLGRRYVVTALGGTQTGVLVHSNSAPFDVTFTKPAQIAALQAVNPLSGGLTRVPYNKFGMVVRKGLIPLANQAYVVGYKKVEYLIPAGVDLADPISLAALVSFGEGVSFSVGTGLVDAFKTGTLA